ncbi:YTH domain-containing protein ECT2-like isoform X6 [Magnolia sinica]|uniref:YTH domain-containing protein ECT2-like isoform X6 n=1 Tax=Magnolia sinica TaxID=86752 RepID=UPI00265AF038|nr:YTH domain-containing protein ECT2-like isoform X6 [Magnolia sinica]
MSFPQSRLFLSTKAVDMGLKSDSCANFAEQNMPTSCISPLGDDTSSIKEGNNSQRLVADQNVCHPSTSDHSYYSSGYDGGTHPVRDELADFLSGDGVEMPFSGVESDTGPMFYYIPGHSPYNLAALMGLDEQCVGQQSFFPSSWCLQPPVLNGSEAVSSYAGDSTSLIANSQNRAAVLAAPKPNVPAHSGDSTPLIADSQNRAAMLTATKPNVSAPSPSGAAVLTATKPNVSAPSPSRAAVLTATKPNVSAPSPSTSLIANSQNRAAVLAAPKPNVPAHSGDSTPLVADSQNRAAMLSATKPNVSAPSLLGAAVLTATKPNVSAPSPLGVAVLTATKPDVSAPSPLGAAVLNATKPNVSAPSPSGAAVVTATKPNVFAPSPSASLKLKGMNSTKSKGTSDTKASAPPSDSKSHASTASSNFLNSSFHSQPMKPANKASKEGSTFHSSSLPKGYYPMGKISSFSSQGNGGSSQQNGFRNFRPDGQSFVHNDRFHMREKFDRVGVYGSSNILNCGPRALQVSQLNASSSSSQKTRLSSSIRRDQYNLKDFETRYEQAMFFVIRSFSEDDIHKSIKYNVWASTQIGNKKLDAAFHDAETRSSNKGAVCPIFLFFSVNASGQFVGLAEMIGQVDFKKNMDFWQFNGKWDGFFPLKWHVIKDIPNNQFYHIILENNGYKPVTISRDTQEIGFPQGLEMLEIFKNYPAKTSILDDFDFYEDQEKSKSSNHSSAHSRTSYSSSQQKHLEIVGARKAVGASTREGQQTHLQLWEQGKLRKHQ